MPTNDALKVAREWLAETFLGIPWNPRVRDSLASFIDSQRREAEIKALKWVQKKRCHLQPCLCDVCEVIESRIAELEKLSGGLSGRGVSSERKEPNAAL
jgi:hypothetical protein